MKKNVRELEGALNSVLIYYKINSVIPTLEVAKKLLIRKLLDKKFPLGWKKRKRGSSKIVMKDGKPYILDSDKDDDEIKDESLYAYLQKR